MTQFPKIILALAAGILLAPCTRADSGDNAAQAAARAALMQAMSQTSVPSQATAAAPAQGSQISAIRAVASNLPPEAAPAPAKACASGMCPACAAKAAGSTMDNQAQAAARAVLLQDLGGAQVAPASSISTPPLAPVKQPALVQASSASPAISPAQMMKPVVAASPAQAPLPSTITTNQASQLQALDALYNSNQITPLDYFNRREAILKGQ